jgi:hypothetical protein
VLKRIAIVAVAVLVVMSITFVLAPDLYSASGWANHTMEPLSPTEQLALERTRGYLHSISTENPIYAELTIHDDTIVLWVFGSASRDEYQQFIGALIDPNGDPRLPESPTRYRRLEVRSNGLGTQMMPPIERGDSPPHG